MNASSPSEKNVLNRKLLELVRLLFILPKGIKRKNQEGYKMLDFTCTDGAQEDDYENLFDNLINSVNNSQAEIEENFNATL